MLPMKSIKQVALGAFLTLCVFCAVLYSSSCSKDSCGSVTCLNQSKCSAGICGPCKTGTSGTNCEIAYRNIYASTYRGSHPDTSRPTDTTSTLKFIADVADTADFSTMHVEWRDTGTLKVNLAIRLNNSTPSGSTFSIDSTVVGGVAYSGYGNINGNTANMDLRQTFTGGNVVILRFINYYKK